MNIFRQAYGIITTKTTDQMTDDEIELVSRATSFMANELLKAFREYDNLPVSEGLLALAEMVELERRLGGNGKGNNETLHRIRLCFLA